MRCALLRGPHYHVSYLRFHLGALKLALEWVFLWGRGRVNYLFFAVIKKKKAFVPHMHFLAKLELQFVWDLVVNLSEEIEK